jgi:Pyruvate/2-oxoglutarate dehydrogenase complex, dihydrolipoamide dehydrogenase (E3) component, and related enzymes
MAHMDYDIAIIGGGSGGLTAARIAAALGARVLLIDKERLGGDCLYTGCVPSKSLLHVARQVHESKQLANRGFTTASQSDIDMEQITTYIQGVIERIHESEAIYVEGATVKFGSVSFTSPTTLLLNGEKVTSHATILATGSHPAIPPIEGIADVHYLTNEDVFHLHHLPASIIIAGGGPVGVELGQALTRLGVHVTLLQRAARILPKEDEDVSRVITQVLQSEGAAVETQTRVLKVEHKENKKVVTAQQGKQLVTFEADEILIATGRQPNVDGLNLEVAGVTFTDKGIEVDDYLQTANPRILAIGDVIGRYLFTHVAAYQAGVAVRNALLPLGKKKVDYRVVPWTTFTDPEAARVGLTPHEAEKAHQHVRVITLPWQDIDRAQTENETNGFLKLVLAGKKDEIVGAHLVGAHAGELLGEIALAMQHHLTIGNLTNTIHTYPTLSTGIQQAAFEAYLTSAEARTNRAIIQTALRLRR